MSERSFVLIGILFFIIFMLKFIYLIVVNDLGLEGNIYDSLEKQIKHYDEQNQLLREQIWQNRAYTTIEQDAKYRGFVPAKYYFLK